MDHPKTIFIDIDGTILYYDSNTVIDAQPPIVLSDVKEKMSEWVAKDYKIILTTARKEGLRAKTIKQLEESNIQYDLLIMGLNTGQRVLMNDKKTVHSEDKAISINLVRNKGLRGIEI